MGGFHGLVAPFVGSVIDRYYIGAAVLLLPLRVWSMSTVRWVLLLGCRCAAFLLAFLLASYLPVSPSARPPVMCGVAAWRRGGVAGGGGGAVCSFVVHAVGGHQRWVVPPLSGGYTHHHHHHRHRVGWLYDTRVHCTVRAWHGSNTSRPLVYVVYFIYLYIF